MMRLLLAIFVLAQPWAHGYAAELPPQVATGFVSVSGSDLIGTDGVPIHLRGISLANWLVPEGYMFGFDTAVSPRRIRQLVSELVGEEASNEFWSQWRDNFISEDDIKFLKHTGFNLVRIPFDYRDFTPEEYPELWSDRGFSYIDRIIDWSAKNDLFVLLDMHAAPCGQTGSNIDNSYGSPHLFDDPRCLKRMRQVWRHVAEHYSRSPTVIGYELLNEPMPYIQGQVPKLSKLTQVYQDVSAAIKEVDTKHLIFFDGANWAGSFQNFEKPLLVDGAVYVFHHYWSDPTDAGFREFLDFRGRLNVPVFMGEAGENTDEWVREFRCRLEANRIGWAFWPYKKLSSSSSVRTYSPPQYWDEIKDYQKRILAPQLDYQKPKIERSRVLTALGGLIENVKYANSVFNADFVAALGLKQGAPC